MKIRLHPRFKKNYKIRISLNHKLSLQTKERIELFRSDPNNPILKDHTLIGAKKGLRSFSITGDIRIIYQPADTENGEIIFYDIGSHNQVY